MKSLLASEKNGTRLQEENIYLQRSLRNLEEERLQINEQLAEAINNSVNLRVELDATKHLLHTERVVHELMEEEFVVNKSSF